MIDVEQVSYRYPEGDQVLREVSFSLHPGEYVLVSGPSGSGKSTLGYLCCGLVPHFFGGQLYGSVRIQGKDLRRLRVPDLLTEVGLVFQNADAQLFNSTVEQEMAYGLENLGLPPAEISRRIRRTAQFLDLGELLPRPPLSLSGGEKRLATIASVLCLEPPLIILDEPFAHLDWEGTRRVREALAAIHAQGRGVVIIEQRLEGFVEDATRCLVLDRGCVAYDGPPKAAMAVLRKKGLLPHYPVFREAPPSGGRTLLETRNLSYREGDRNILRNIDLDLLEGRITAIVGRNGAGKTTLIKHLNGLLRPTSGQVRCLDREVHTLPPRDRVSNVGVSFQNPNDQFFKTRVHEEIEIGLKVSGRLSRDILEKTTALFDLQGFLDRSPYSLSEGQKKRVALASIAVLAPRLLVLDEPTVGQDGRFLETLAFQLHELRKQGASILLVTHDLEFARAVAETWLVLYQGRLVGAGPPEVVLQDPELIRMGALPGPPPAKGEIRVRA